MASNENKEPCEQPETKKLRSCEPDLKVVIGTGADSTATRWHHSATLATKSKYVDAMLATPMKEQEDRTLSFPEMEPQTWDDMMRFLDNPLAARHMTVEEAIKVAKYYDKYEFADGLTLCDHVLTDFLSGLEQKEKTEVPNLSLIIDSVCVAKDANLEKSLKEGTRYIWDKLRSTSIPYGGTMFSKRDLERLNPLTLCDHMLTDFLSGLEQKEKTEVPNLSLIIESLCVAKDANLENSFHEGMRYIWSKLRSTAIPYGGTMFSKRDLERLNPLLAETRGEIYVNYPNYAKNQPGDKGFPKSFVEGCQKWNAKQILFDFIHHIELSGTRCKADGEFCLVSAYGGCWPSRSSQQCWEKDRIDNWGGVEVRFKIELRDEGWAIMTEPEDDEVDETVCWVAPYSQNLLLPPTNGWKKADKLACGEPTIKYILNEVGRVD